MIKETTFALYGRGTGGPGIEKPIRKGGQGRRQSRQGAGKIPKKQVRQTEVDQDRQSDRKLVLETRRSRPQIVHAVRDAPGNAALGIPREIRETEQDNVGVESP